MTQIQIRNTETEKIYKSPPIGQEISCVMSGISKKLLVNHSRLKKLLKDALARDKFSVLKDVSYKFKPQGYTIIFLLAESHLAVHTYPEYGSIHFNMYSCRGPEDAEKTFNYVKEKLKPKKILFLKKNEIPVAG